MPWLRFLCLTCGINELPPPEANDKGAGRALEGTSSCEPAGAATSTCPALETGGTEAAAPAAAPTPTPTPPYVRRHQRTITLDGSEGSFISVGIPADGNNDCDRSRSDGGGIGGGGGNGSPPLWARRPCSAKALAFGGGGTAASHSPAVPSRFSLNGGMPVSSHSAYGGRGGGDAAIAAAAAECGSTSTSMYGSVGYGSRTVGGGTADAGGPPHPPPQLQRPSGGRLHRRYYAPAIAGAALQQAAVAAAPRPVAAQAGAGAAAAAAASAQAAAAPAAVAVAVEAGGDTADEADKEDNSSIDSAATVVLVEAEAATGGDDVAPRELGPSSLKSPWGQNVSQRTLLPAHPHQLLQPHLPPLGPRSPGTSEAFAATSSRPWRSSYAPAFGPASGVKGLALEPGAPAVAPAAPAEAAAPAVAVATVDCKEDPTAQDADAVFKLQQGKERPPLYPPPPFAPSSGKLLMTEACPPRRTMTGSSFGSCNNSISLRVDLSGNGGLGSFAGDGGASAGAGGGGGAGDGAEGVACCASQGVVFATRVAAVAVA